MELLGVVKMLLLYNKNGLIHWTQKQIRIREWLCDYFVAEITEALYKLNNAWTFHQCDAPILSEFDYVDSEYLNRRELYDTDDQDLLLRAETTPGSYIYADWLQANPQNIKVPLCVWQYGKSFRREQDQPTKFIRLKEFYQLEFQCVYSEGTKCDYMEKMILLVQDIFSTIMPWKVQLIISERLPSYSQKTIDVMTPHFPGIHNGMELCSISQRIDYDHPVLEIAIGMDRCMVKFLEK